MSEMPSHVPGWIAAAFLTAIGTLASAIAFMFRLDKAESQKLLLETQQRHTSEIGELKSIASTLRTESNKCAEDREHLRVRLATVETKLEILGNSNNLPNLQIADNTPVPPQPHY